jgi:hypothetical protein
MSRIMTVITHRVDVGSTADVSEANALSVFRIEVACISDMLSTLLPPTDYKQQKAESTSA